MQLKDLIGVDDYPVVTISDLATLADAASVMNTEKTSAVIVTAANQIQGIITRGDILGSLATSSSVKKAWNTSVGQVMSSRFISAAPQMTISQAINRMITENIGHLPVCEKETVTAVLTLGRLLQEENRQLHEEAVHLQTYIDTLHDAPND